MRRGCAEPIERPAHCGNRLQRRSVLRGGWGRTGRRRHHNLRIGERTAHKQLRCSFCGNLIKGGCEASALEDELLRRVLDLSVAA
jgi:hypothetical protein